MVLQVIWEGNKKQFCRSVGRELMTGSVGQLREKQRLVLQVSWEGSREWFCRSVGREVENGSVGQLGGQQKVVLRVSQERSKGCFCNLESPVCNLVTVMIKRYFVFGSLEQRAFHDLPNAQVTRCLYVEILQATGSVISLFFHAQD